MSNAFFGLNPPYDFFLTARVPEPDSCPIPGPQAPTGVDGSPPPWTVTVPGVLDEVIRYVRVVRKFRVSQVK